MSTPNHFFKLGCNLMKKTGSKRHTVGTKRFLQRPVSLFAVMVIKGSYVFGIHKIHNGFFYPHLYIVKNTGNLLSSLTGGTFFRCIMAQYILETNKVKYKVCLPYFEHRNIGSLIRHCLTMGK